MYQTYRIFLFNLLCVLLLLKVFFLLSYLSSYFDSLGLTIKRKSYNLQLSSLKLSHCWSSLASSHFSLDNTIVIKSQVKLGSYAKQSTKLITDYSQSSLRNQVPWDTATLQKAHNQKPAPHNPPCQDHTGCSGRNEDDELAQLMRRRDPTKLQLMAGKFYAKKKSQSNLASPHSQKKNFQ